MSDGSLYIGTRTSGMQDAYVNAIVDRADDDFPPWLHIGLKKLLGSMIIGNNSFNLPPLVTDKTQLERRLIPTPALLAAALRDGRFLSLEKLFSTTGGSSPGIYVSSNPYVTQEPAETLALNRGANDLWSDECYEFVYYCMLGAGGKYREPFLKLAALSSGEPVDERAFRVLFGIDYQTMLLELWRFTDYFQLKGFRVRGLDDKTASAPELVFRKATDGEVGRIRGETLLDLHPHQSARAHLSLIAPYLRGSRDPQLLAYLGLQEAAAHKTERAKLFLEAAVAAKTTVARAYLKLAQIREQEAEAKPEGPNGTLSLGQVQSVAQLLSVALQMPPYYAATYRTLMNAWQHTYSLPDHETFVVMDRGAERFLYDSDLIYQNASLHLRAGLSVETIKLCDIGLVFARTELDRNRLTALRVSAMQAAATPGSP